MPRSTAASSDQAAAAAALAEADLPPPQPFTFLSPDQLHGATLVVFPQPCRRLLLSAAQTAALKDALEDGVPLTLELASASIAAAHESQLV
ncbi:hypothetical protein HaLaN_06613 [Haematococcus lacustris]|uniref:Uncharacterized protein n=1 Tax=Haematococcus lacustris TaxID=44745 RepID=A0A699Z6Q7_HAELA|nr:hypothetical protein HaLaN_06613 [Haematococcus lacustris]